MSLRRVSFVALLAFCFVFAVGVKSGAAAETSITVGGHVRNQSGQTVPGVLVFLKTSLYYSPSPNTQESGVQTVVSDGDGYFSFQTRLRMCNAPPPTGGSIYRVFAINNGALTIGSGMSGCFSDPESVCPNADCMTVTVGSSPEDANSQNLGFAGCPIIGRPVNAMNGNMYLQQNDYVLPGIGENINLTRTYNSKSQSAGMFGVGWSTDYDESLVAFGNSDISLLRLNLTDGRAVFFGDAGNNLYTPATADFYGQVVKNASDNSYTLTFKDGRVHQFDSSGRLTSQKDRNNNQTALTYNGFGQLTAITDSFGRALTVTPNASGRVEQSATVWGRRRLMIMLRAS